MAKMTTNKKLLTITILCIALVQMPILALTPGIEQMRGYFSNRPLSDIQTAVSLPNLISMLSALLSAVLITKGVISKKTAVLLGLGLSIGTAFAALALHTQFWHLILFSVILGTSLGLFIPTTMSILFDAFNEEERQRVAGFQTSFINIGGIIMSTVGGLLATRIWYGGFLAFFLMVPVAVLAAYALPGKRAGGQAAETAPAKSKLPGSVYYYGALIFLFMMIYNVGGTNLSTHLAASGIGNAATAGFAAAFQMAGGVASGLVFSKISSKIRDYVIVLAFAAVFVGFTILNLGHASVVLVFAGVFIVGASLSLIIPQCMLSVSNCVDPSNSATATTIVGCLAPGGGGFVSPVIFTNLTTALGGASTNFRYQFVGLAALLVGAAVAVVTGRLNKRASAALPARAE